ncbi:MAG: DUF512 domain-containing protein [Thermoanaerobacteraceae bacterium]|nr:DUF512 domain-containing protein [Thermoanaerobacteraceae bacterium]
MEAKLWQQLLQSIRENVLPITSRCNVSCIFCSHRQNPPGVETFTLPPLTWEQVREVGQFLDASKKIVIGESATRIKEGEPLTHPQWVRILSFLRQLYPETPISITTNGILLTDSHCRALAELAPLEVNLSLNSASCRGRRRLLGGATEQAIRAVRLLREYGICFHGSVVALPWLTGWDDLEYTIIFLAEHGARTVRVLAPGFTRYAALEMRFGPSFLNDLHTFIQTVQRKTAVPVLVEPPPVADLQAEVAGILRDSPAEKAGLKRGDKIVAVGGKTVFSRVDAYRRLTDVANPEVTFERQRRQLRTVLRKEAYVAPGAVFYYDLAPEVWKRFLDVLNNCRAARVLVLTSRFAYPMIQVAAEKVATAEVKVMPVQNRTFGGSIGCAGLLTVDDLLPVIKENHRRFDLITVPRMAFDQQGRDLLGNTIWDLEKAFPVVSV